MVTAQVQLHVQAENKLKLQICTWTQTDTETRSRAGMLHRNAAGGQWRTHTLGLTAQTKQAAFHTEQVCNRHTSFSSLFIFQSVNFSLLLVLSVGFSLWYWCFFIADLFCSVCVSRLLTALCRSVYWKTSDVSVIKDFPTVESIKYHPHKH